MIVCLGLSAAFLGLEPAAPGLGAPLQCIQAQLIEGQLRCDGELIDDLRELCGHAQLESKWALAAGDAVAPGVCACPECSEDPISRMPPDQLAALGQRVDLNSASLAELASLPGIGPKLAVRIVEARPFASVDEVTRVRGIGEHKREAMRARARVSSR